MKNRILNIFTLSIVSLVLLTSCNDWLDVKPIDKVLEDEMFESQKGFQTALNGVYIELNSNTLYGSNLSAGMVDVMAQYYKVKGNPDHVQSLYAEYSYAQTSSKAKIDNIWRKSYQVIFNLNTIIETAKADTKVLNEEFREIILGESYALRAMLHFDILRLFGPIYQLEADKESIPYQKGIEFKIENLLSAADVVKEILADITLAETHLANDPVLEKGATFEPDEDGSTRMSYRQQRMNLLATGALKARVHLWSGNTQEALAAAKGVINKTHEADPKLFPFSDYADITSTASPDRIFASEILFGHYNSQRSDIQRLLFTSALSEYVILTMFPERIEAMFDDDNDFRKKLWKLENVDSREVHVFTKYADVAPSGTDLNKLRFDVMARNIVPAFRISEMYLIAAESTSNNAEAVAYINAVRNARNSLSIQFTSEEKERVIGNEYLREFLGEGQMFYYYKRKAFENLPNGGDPTVTFNMDLSNYVLPLPDSEISQRN